jgi:hypothetical protein
MTKRYSAEDIEMENYEKIFDEFYDKITPITDRAVGFYYEPLKKPHNFSNELLQEIELLHIKLSTALYRLRFGEIREKLENSEIEFVEFERQVKEIYDHLYKHF